jgi:ferredoxin
MKEELSIPTNSPLETKVSFVNISDPFNKNEVTGANTRVIDLVGIRSGQIVDGLICMQGSSPVLSAAVRTGIIMAKHNPLCVDGATCRATSVDPLSVARLQLSRQQFTPREERRVKIVGNVRPSEFRMPSRSRMFVLAEHIILTMNYLPYSKFMLGGDALSLRARLMSDIATILGTRYAKCAECVNLCPMNSICANRVRVDESRRIVCMICAQVRRQDAILATHTSRANGIHRLFRPRLRPPPRIVLEKFMKCGKCIAACPADAIKISRDALSLDNARCVRCADGHCKIVCNFNAIQ